MTEDSKGGLRDERKKKKKGSRSGKQKEEKSSENYKVLLALKQGKSEGLFLL